MTTFFKRNQTRFADAPYKEASGLRWLARSLPADCVSVPAVLAVDESGVQMTAIAVRSGCRTELAVKLGQGLAAMHAEAQAFFGFEEDNYIGLNPQFNTPCDRWGEFFLHERLMRQIDLIEDAAFARAFRRRLQAIAHRLADFLDESCDRPSLVHGDLWSGNYLCDGERVWLIDPAVYFGDREVDIAMTELFGGFPAAFYEAYAQALPLSQDYPCKRDIYNLYHYLNHYNLFGDGYLEGCERGFAAIESV